MLVTDLSEKYHRKPNKKMKGRVQKLLWAATLVAIMSVQQYARVGDWDHVGIRIANEPSSGGGDNNMFDRMHHCLYVIATEWPGKESNLRKEYTLDAIPKSEGGLNDDVSAQLPSTMLYACV